MTQPRLWSVLTTTESDLSGYRHQNDFTLTGNACRNIELVKGKKVHGRKRGILSHFVIKRTKITVVVFPDE